MKKKTTPPPEITPIPECRWATQEEVDAICAFFQTKVVSIYLLRSWWGISFTLQGKTHHFAMEEWVALLHPELEQKYEYVDVDGA